MACIYQIQSQEQFSSNKQFFVGIMSSNHPRAITQNDGLDHITPPFAYVSAKKEWNDYTFAQKADVIVISMVPQQ